MLRERNFNELTPEIRRRLAIPSPLAPGQVSLQEHTDRTELNTQLARFPLFSSAGPSEFRKSVSFSVPAGQGAIGLETFRYGNDGSSYSGSMQYDFAYGPTLRARMADLYEVHVERANGRDHYTIAYTGNFIGGMKVTVDGRSFLVLSHEDSAPSIAGESTLNRDAPHEAPLRPTARSSDPSSSESRAVEPTPNLASATGPGSANNSLPSLSGSRAPVPPSAGPDGRSMSGPSLSRPSLIQDNIDRGAETRPSASTGGHPAVADPAELSSAAVGPNNATTDNTTPSNTAAELGLGDIGSGNRAQSPGVSAPIGSELAQTELDRPSAQRPGSSQTAEAPELASNSGPADAAPGSDESASAGSGNRAQSPGVSDPLGSELAQSELDRPSAQRPGSAETAEAPELASNSGPADNAPGSDGPGSSRPGNPAQSPSVSDPLASELAQSELDRPSAQRPGSAGTAEGPELASNSGPADDAPGSDDPASAGLRSSQSGNRAQSPDVSDPLGSELAQTEPDRPSAQRPGSSQTAESPELASNSGPADNAPGRDGPDSSRSGNRAQLPGVSDPLGSELAQTELDRPSAQRPGSTEPTEAPSLASNSAPIEHRPGSASQRGDAPSPSSPTAEQHAQPTTEQLAARPQRQRQGESRPNAPDSLETRQGSQSPQPAPGSFVSRPELSPSGSTLPPGQIANNLRSSGLERPQARPGTVTSGEPPELGQSLAAASLPEFDRFNLRAELGSNPLTQPEISRRTFQAPSFEVAEREPERPQFDPDQEQQRAELGYFAVNRISSERKDFWVPSSFLESQDQNVRESLNQFGAEVYAHAYYPPERAFSSVASIRSPGQRNLDSSFAPPTLAEVYEGIDHALRGEPVRPDIIPGSSQYGALERARRADSILERWSDLLEQREATYPNEPTGEQDVADLRLFASRMRSADLYLVRMQEYVRGRLHAEAPEVAGTISELPDYISDQGCHRSVLAVQSALERMLGSSRNTLTAEAGIQALKEVQFNYPWQFSYDDICDLQDLHDKAKAAVDELEQVESESSSLFSRGMPWSSAVAAVTRELNSAQQQRMHRQLAILDEQIETLRSSYFLLPQGDETDAACSKFLRLLPHGNLNFNPLPAGYRIDEKRAALSTALTSIDAEIEALRTVPGHYPRLRIEQLLQRRKDFSTFVPHADSAILLGDESLASLLEAIPDASQAQSAAEQTHHTEDVADFVLELLGPLWSKGLNFP